MEEISTRSEDISIDYDFFHSNEMLLECGNDYEMKVVPYDLNAWLSRMYLGDADGFSIMYYSDVDSIVYWANDIHLWRVWDSHMESWSGRYEVYGTVCKIKYSFGIKQPFVGCFFHTQKFTKGR